MNDDEGNVSALDVSTVDYRSPQTSSSITSELTVKIDEIDSKSLQRLVNGLLHVLRISTNSIERSSWTTDDGKLRRDEDSRSEGRRETSELCSS